MTGSPAILFWLCVASVTVPVFNLDTKRHALSACFVGETQLFSPLLAGSSKSKSICGRPLSVSSELRVGPCSLNKRGQGLLRMHETSAGPMDIRTPPLELLEAATKFALARQEELEMQIRRDLVVLEKQAKLADENKKWDELINSVDCDAVEGGTPWEPDEDDIIQSGLFASKALQAFRNGSYVPLTDKPVDLIGSFEGLSGHTIDTKLVSAKFDDVIAEQKSKVRPKSLWDGFKDGWKDADRESVREQAHALQKHEDGVSLLRMKDIEHKIAGMRPTAKVASEAARPAHTTQANKAKDVVSQAPSAPRSSAKTARVPWEHIVMKMERLINTILRDRFEGGGTTEEKLRRLDDIANFTSLRSALRLPEMSPPTRVATSKVEEASDAGMVLSADTSAAEVPDEEESDSLLEMLTAPELEALSKLKGDFDDQVQSYRNKVDAITFSTQELINDHLRWWPEHRRPAYDSVDGFRNHVAALCREAALSGNAENSTSWVLDAPWRDIKSLLVDRETAVLQKVEERSGAKKGKLAQRLDVFIGDETWAELEEQAESQWRFYDPAEYYRFEKIKEKRDSLISSQSAREKVMTRMAAEAEVALDEYFGVMMDLGWSKSGDILTTADSAVSVFTGKGKELGLNAGFERSLRHAMVLAYGSIIASPVFGAVADYTPLIVDNWANKMEAAKVMLWDSFELHANIDFASMIDALMLPLTSSGLF